MPVLKVKKNGVWEELGGTAKLDGGNADTLDGYHADQFATKADLNNLSSYDHTHSSYVNQNAFSNVQVGSTIIAADNTTDTLTLVAGNNIVLTPNATSDQVTIDSTHPDSGVAAGTYQSVTVDTQGHVTAGTNPTTLSGYGITDAYTKTEVDSNFAPAYTYGTDDLIAGSSTLATGKLYFVYE